MASILLISLVPFAVLCGLFPNLRWLGSPLQCVSTMVRQCPSSIVYDHRRCRQSTSVSPDPVLRSKALMELRSRVSILDTAHTPRPLLPRLLAGVSLLFASDFGQPLIGRVVGSLLLWELRRYLNRYVHHLHRGCHKA